VKKRNRQKLMGPLLATLILGGFISQANAAAGWTDFGTIIELNQNPANGPGNELLFMRISVTTNPSDPGACQNRDGFYLPVTTDLQKRLFAMLMFAKASDKRIRVYVTGSCHLWGYAEMQGLVME